MTLRSARVRDFQSIADAEVGFGRFTVLVGPSSSGKSAFLRAVRACLRNTAVPANVRQGTSKAQIDVTFDDADVGIERGKSLSTYRLGEDVFTKSGRSVPTEIARAIRLPLIEGVDATFTFQFDRPFLLSEPGSQGAQVLGSLTNVSMLHTAVREANRRRQATQSTLGTRREDVVRLAAQMTEFADLPARKAAVQDAEEALAAAQATGAQVEALQRSTSRVRRLSQDLDWLVAVEPPHVAPLVEQADQTSADLARLTTAVRRVRNQASALRNLASLAEAHQREVADTEAEHHDLLTRLGHCPTCGAKTGEPVPHT